jgi:hypothetical protein
MFLPLMLSAQEYYTPFFVPEKRRKLDLRKIKDNVGNAGCR